MQVLHIAVFAAFALCTANAYAFRVTSVRMPMRVMMSDEEATTESEPVELETEDSIPTPAPVSVAPVALKAQWFPGNMKAPMTLDGTLVSLT